MDVLLAFIMKFLLVPILATIAIFVINGIGSIRRSLNIKRLIIFILITAIILSLPSLLGLLKNEFVWGGLILTVLCYVIAGIFLNLFFKSKLFETIGIKTEVFKLIVMLILLMLVAWIYYLLFYRFSKLPYSLWAMTNVAWTLIPILYTICEKLFLQIPPAFHRPWIVEENAVTANYWENKDPLKSRLVTVKIKRKSLDKEYASLAVRLPDKVTVGVWFNKFIDDQNARFPNDQIIGSEGEEKMGWVFYTSRWFNIPLFIRVLNAEADSEQNKVRRKQIIYIKRTKVKDAENEK